MNALDVLLLADQAKRDPAAAEKLAALTQRAKNERPAAPLAAAAAAARSSIPARLPLLAELRADKIVRLPGAGPVAPGNDRGPLKVDWPGGAGICAGLFAGTLDGADASLSMVSVRIAINGDEDLFTDGTNPEFVPLVALHPRDHRWFRLERAVTAQERWMVTFRHEGPAGAPPITPFLVFAYQRK
jgi:hypothetical protein